jgi:hypothetical protein
MPRTMSVFEVLRKIERGSIDLSPDFQRNFVWDPVRQSRLVESVLLKIPLPVFYLDATTEERWQVVDGLQRLSSLRAFRETGALHLQGLQILPDLNGAGFHNLPRWQQQIFEDAQLHLITIEPGTPRDLKFQIFQRVNTGGVNLNDQEIRHAIFEGPARNLLRELAESQAFRLATNGLVESRRMEDRECVLRFLTFRLNPYDTIGSEPGGWPGFDNLLNQTMDDLNQATPTMQAQYADSFQESMHKAQAVFGELAFREVRDQLETGPFRKELFEVWSVSLLRYSIEELQRAGPALVKASIETMSNDSAFSAAIQPGANDRRSVITRFGTIEALLRQVIG